MHAIAPIAQEAELDRKLEQLIDKVMRGSATTQDMSLYRDLTNRRVSLMQTRFARKRGK